MPATPEPVRRIARAEIWGSAAEVRFVVRWRGTGDDRRFLVILAGLA
jgi:hypothetical protein